MSVLQVYLSWANSVLGEVGSSCPGVTAIQEGRVLCLLIDLLSVPANILHKVEATEAVEPYGYILAALDHMQQHGVKFHFTPQDILDGDIKSILDALWLIILNYGIHNIENSPYQRSVGAGKKVLLDWCQTQLDTQLDQQNSLTYNLCEDDNFAKLLSKFTEIPVISTHEKEDCVQTQLKAAEDLLGIKADLISPCDISEGTIDEHTLMIYISLLRHKTEGAGSVVQLEDNTFSLAYQSPISTDERSGIARDQPTIVLTEAAESSAGSSREEEEEEAEISTHIYKAAPSPTKGSPDGTDPDTSDWNSASSGSPLSSTHERQLAQNTEHSSETDRILMETISQHVEDKMSGDESANHPHASRIPVRTLTEGESQRSISSPGRLEGEGKGGAMVRKISVKVKRPRSPNSIMSEARLRQEQEKERRTQEKEQRAAAAVAATSAVDKDEPVLTGSASEGGDMSESGFATALVREETDPLKSDEDDKEKIPCVSPIPMKPSPASPRSPSQYNGLFEAKENVPVMVMPAQNHDMTLLLEALRHARTEANFHDQQINSPAEQTDFKEVIDANIEKLEAQLEAVKEQSREMFQNPEREATQETSNRGRTAKREAPSGRQGECRSPPRGILDMMANQGADREETELKENVSYPVPQQSAASPERTNPPGILRYRRSRSPTDHTRSYSSPEVQKEDFGSPSRGQNRQSDELDPDKRLIRFLTNEIENLKLKMKVIEKRSRSPGSVSPLVAHHPQDRDRSPSAISSHARARFNELGTDHEKSSYSPTRRSYSPGMVETRMSRSPTYGLDSRGESPYRSGQSRTPSISPARSPQGIYRPRTPESRLSRDTTRPMSPSNRVLSLQDLSTAIQDDPDGHVNFSPASGGKRINLGYTSPIRKVNAEIWGNDVSEEDYYKDTAKYEKWKRLIARDAVSDEDMLELKQALASCLVELDILQAKLNNANTDIREKMMKTTDVLNDCRAHLTKSQAENAELRSQNEREKARADALELRMKEIEENLHSAKSNQDDLTQELEESVYTLKGIVGLDKNTMSQLEQENDKLRERVSTVQRENIKLKEDYNEVKIYNDKAQTTIKDLKEVLEDNRTERKQLVSEIKKLQSQGHNTKISNIVNHYMEKGLYEEPEKEEPGPAASERSRSPSPQPRRFDKYSRARSASPIQTRAKFESSYYRPITPMPSLSALSSKPVGTSYNTAAGVLGSSRSQTPTAGSTYNYEDISPAVTSAGHQIYPHRRTRSYVKRFGQNDLDESYSNLDLEDPELKELLQPQKISYDLDLSDSHREGGRKTDTFEDEVKSAKRQLQYSTYIDSNQIKPCPVEVTASRPSPVESRPKSPYRYPNQVLDRKSALEEELENRKFIYALDTAVKETPAQAVKKQFQDSFDNDTSARGITNGFGGGNISDMTSRESSPGRWRSPGRGILKSNKSVQNLSIKEGILPKRSYESRSYSPSARLTSHVQSSHSPSSAATRSYSPGASSKAQMSYPSVNTGRAYSPSGTGTRAFSPEAESAGYSPAGKRYGRMDGGTRDSGYSTPNSQLGVRSYSAGRPAVESSRSASPKPLGKTIYTGRKSPVISLLTEEERRYADLLIDKYTRQHMIGISLPSS